MNKFSSFYILFILLFAAQTILAQHMDCNTALDLCDNSPLHIVPDGGIGIADPDIGSTCVSQEFNPVWVKWTVMEDGILTFVLTPEIEEQDLDFIVFQSGSDYDCATKTQIRCMAAGAVIGQPPNQWINCIGSTGLAIGNTDVEELPGCQSGNNNFLAPIQALAGDHYIMLINDFSNTGKGYHLSFTGTAVLGCTTGTAYPELVLPQVTFAVYPTVSTGTIFIRNADAGLPDNNLNVFNTEGQIVYSNETLGETPFQVDLHHLPPGIYFAVLRTSNSIQTQKFLLTK